MVWGEVVCTIGAGGGVLEARGGDQGTVEATAGLRLGSVWPAGDACKLSCVRVEVAECIGEP